MVFDIVPLIILFAALAVIGLIVWRRLPYLAQIRVEEIPEHQQEMVKQTILENRLRRRLKELSGRLKQRLPKTHVTLIRRAIRERWRQLVKREEAWRLRLFRQSHPTTQAEQLASGIREAGQLIEQEAWPIAEKKLLLLIRLSPRHLETYRLLAEVYERQKNWRDAAEAFRYAVTQGEPHEQDYLYLGELYRQAGDHRQALEMFKAAFELDPRDPKNLDFLCEESILEGNLQLAKQALAILKEVNPENQKISVFQDRLKNLKK